MLLDLARRREVLFIGGKGGVGKTSTASALGLRYARGGQRVLLVSTDPAHNIGHIWERTIGDAIVPLWPAPDEAPGRQAQPREGKQHEGKQHEEQQDRERPGQLDGLEIDPELTIDRHLRQVGSTLKDLMPEHLHRQVDQHLRLSAQSPGTHESAVLERIAGVLEENLGHYDLVIFDTAPTGHTARLMALPEIMSAWTEGLLTRRSAAERHGAAIRSLAGDDDPESSAGAGRDRRIRAILTQRKQRFERLREVIADSSRCSFVIVLTPERLPVAESIELHEELTRTGVDVGGLVVNRVSPADAGDFLATRREAELRQLDRLRSALPQIPCLQVPLRQEDLVGAVALERLGDHFG